MLRFGMSTAMGAILLASVSGAALADVKSGVDAYQRGDYAAALKEWRPLADRGDPDAQFNLAQAYRLGRGVPANLETATGFYRRAAQQNHVEATSLLGILLFQNGKRAEAMPWLGKAADHGDAQAQYLYGTSLFNGDLVAQNLPRAYSMMTLSAAQGFPPARSVLVEMDKHIPLAQRQQGVAMARDMPRAPVAAPVRTARNSVRPTPAPAPPRASRAPTPTFSIPRAQDNGPPARPVGANSSPVVATAKPRPAPMATGGRWKIQLGAFGRPASASSLFSSLKSRVRALSNAQPYLVKAGAVTRLQAGPFPTRAAAAGACAAVKAAGQPCFPVAP